MREMTWDTDDTRCLVYDHDTAEYIAEMIQDEMGPRVHVTTVPSTIPGMARIVMQRHVRYYLSRQ